MKRLSYGFTLIEVVIVIAILGILAGLAIPRFTDANEAARGAKLLGDMRTIESMALVFAANNGGKYPKVTTTDTGYTFAPGSEKFNNYFSSGYPLPPKGFLVIQGNNGNTYRYDLSGRQYYYGYNSQQRDGVDFQFTTCDGKSIYEFMNGLAGKGPVSISSSNNISMDTANDLAVQLTESVKEALAKGDFNNFSQGNIDSENVDALRTKTINEILKANGFDLDKYGWSIRGKDTTNYSLYVYPKLTATGFIQATVYQVTNGVVGQGESKTVEVIKSDDILKIPNI